MHECIGGVQTPWASLGLAAALASSAAWIHCKIFYKWGNTWGRNGRGGRKRKRGAAGSHPDLCAEADAEHLEDDDVQYDCAGGEEDDVQFDGAGGMEEGVDVGRGSTPNLLDQAVEQQQLCPPTFEASDDVKPRARDDSEAGAAAATKAPATAPARRRSKRLCLDKGGCANVDVGADLLLTAEREKWRRLEDVNGKLNTLAGLMLNGKRQSDEYVGAMAILAENNPFGMSASQLMQVVSKKVYDYLKHTEIQDEIAGIGANPSADELSPLIERRMLSQQKAKKGRWAKETAEKEAEKQRIAAAEEEKRAKAEEARRAKEREAKDMKAKLVREMYDGRTPAEKEEARRRAEKKEARREAEKEEARRRAKETAEKEAEKQRIAAAEEEKRAKAEEARRAKEREAKDMKAKLVREMYDGRTPAEKEEARRRAEKKEARREAEKEEARRRAESNSSADFEGEPGAYDADGSGHSDGGKSKKSKQSSGKAPLHADSARDKPRKIATEKEVVERMCKLLHVREKIDSARSEEERQFYKDARAILEKGLRHAFANGTYDEVFDDLKRLVSRSGPGLYALLYSIGVALKIGSSVDRKVRADQQKYKVAYDLCDMDKLGKLCPANSEVVTAIKALGPPRLVYHEDKEEQRTEDIQRQIGELYVASLFETSTGTAGELITRWPSERVDKITTLCPADSYSPEDLAFIKAFGYDFFLTWGTYKSNLLNRRKAGDDVLMRLLLDPTDGKFLQLYMLEGAFGKERVKGFVNALEDSVRSEQMQGIVAELRPLLKQALQQLEQIGEIAMETAQAIKDIVASINKDSDDYGHHKAPGTERLVEAAIPKLKEKIEESDGNVLVWERCLFNDVQDSNSEAFEELIPPGSEKVELVEGEEHLLRVTCKMPDGKAVRHLIIRSPFRVFAEETSKEARIGAIEAYMALLSYLRAGGIITSEYAESQALMLRSFLMEWEGLDGDIDGEVKGSVRAARNHAVGEGMCVGGVPRNLKAVSQLLKIGYQETADLRSSLGRELFDILITCFGVPAGPNNPTPLEAGFRCGGVIEAGHLPAMECRHKDCGDDEQPHFSLVGKTKEDFLLPAFKCKCCATSTYLREVELICQRMKSGDQSVTDAQRQRAEKRTRRGNAEKQRIAEESAAAIAISTSRAKSDRASEIAAQTCNRTRSRRS
ncbi:hypothetical protein ACHAXT_007629 [Thalassiosira profunda]